MSEVSIVGYCEPVSCRPNDEVALKLSYPGSVTIDVVELLCGDRANPAMGLRERVVDVPGFPRMVEALQQALIPGSRATFGPSTLLDVAAFTLGCSVRPSLRPDQPQAVLSLGDTTVWWTRDGFSFDPDRDATGPLEHRRWYALHLSVADGVGTLTVTAHPTRSPGGDSTSSGGVVRGVVAMDVVALVVPVTVPGLAAAARCISVVVAWRLDRDGGDEGGVPWGSMDPMDAKSNGCAL